MGKKGAGLSWVFANHDPGTLEGEDSSMTMG